MKINRLLVVLLCVPFFILNLTAQHISSSSSSQYSGDIYHLSGDVGLGTSSPERKLDVRGWLKVKSTAAVIEMHESDYDKKWFLISDGKHFRISQHTTASTNNALFIRDNFNIGIGSNSPDHKLDVKGTIHAEEVLVDLNVEGPDYVFEEDYPLQDLTSLEQYLKKNKHLPEVPSASKMKEEGIKVGEMEMLLLKKVEELTLYTLQQEKQIAKQQALIDSLVINQEEILDLMNTKQSK